MGLPPSFASRTRLLLLPSLLLLPPTPLRRHVGEPPLPAAFSGMCYKPILQTTRPNRSAPGHHAESHASSQAGAGPCPSSFGDAQTQDGGPVVDQQRRPKGLPELRRELLHDPAAPPLPVSSRACSGEKRAWRRAPGVLCATSTSWLKSLR